MKQSLRSLCLDPPRFRPEDVCVFTEPVKVRAGQNAMFKMPFVGQEPIKIQWYREGEELLGDNNAKVEKCGSQSRLLLSRCQRKDTGEIKIKLKNEHGVTEAISQLIVLGEWRKDERRPSARRMNRMWSHKLNSSHWHSNLSKRHILINTTALIAAEETPVKSLGKQTVIKYIIFH